MDFAVQTRQKTNVLFPRVVPPTPPNAPILGVVAPTIDPIQSSKRIGPVRLLAAGETQDFGVAEINGYAAIAILVITDQPFTVRFYEGIAPEGPFLLTKEIPGAAPFGDYYAAFTFLPFGSYGKATLTNDGAVAETQLQFEVQGVPL